MYLLIAEVIPQPTSICRTDNIVAMDIRNHNSPLYIKPTFG